MESYDKALHDIIEKERLDATDIFCECVDAVEYRATEEVADVLFSLFSGEEDFELLESVIRQIDGNENEEICIESLIKAFPRLAIEANEWAKVFLNDFIKYDNMKHFALKSEDKKGKQAIIDFIKTLHSAKAIERYENYPKLKQEYIEDLKKFDEFALELKKSMK